MKGRDRKEGKDQMFKAQTLFRVLVNVTLFTFLRPWEVCKQGLPISQRGDYISQTRAMSPYQKGPSEMTSNTQICYEVHYPVVHGPSGTIQTEAHWVTKHSLKEPKQETLVPESVQVLALAAMSWHLNPFGARTSAHTLGCPCNCSHLMPLRAERQLSLCFRREAVHPPQQLCL